MARYIFTRPRAPTTLVYVEDELKDWQTNEKLEHTQPERHWNRAEQEPSPVYSSAALIAWFKVRVLSHPPDSPTPTEDQDFAAACLFFRKSIRRTEFRRIRAVETPKSWRKQGPRRGRTV
jgi:hypothetical protein